MLKKIKLTTIVLNFLNGLNNENTELKKFSSVFQFVEKPPVKKAEGFCLLVVDKV